MMDSPLAQPGRDSEVLRRFLEFFGLGLEERGEPFLGAVAAAFSRLPYENLTKIIKKAEAGSAERARRWPGEVVADHIALGAGGTCFSLTATLLHLVRALGWRAEPILADRRYGADTHCALLVWVEGAPRLLDPGYLIVKPLPLAGQSELCVPTPFNDVILTPRAGGDRIELRTRQEGRETYRLTFKTSPADPGEFLRAWDASFDWDMTRYPLLTRLRGGEQIYLQGNRLLVRSRTAVERRGVALDELPGRIAGEFSIDGALALKALEVLRRSGETARHGIH